VSDRGILSSLRYLFADFIGEEDETPPFLPEGLPDPVVPVASNAIHLLIDYQSTSYAQLYVDRLRRFVGKPGVDDAMRLKLRLLTADQVDNSKTVPSLGLTGDQPVIIFIHHPPFKVRLKRMDDISLLEPRLFVDAIAGRKNIRHMFFGHLHRPLAGSWRGIPVSTLRATSHQVALDFVIEGRIPGSHEPPAYGVVLLEEDQMIVHMHDFLDRTNTFLL